MATPASQEGEIKWTGAKVRQSFIDYFGQHAHTHWPSSPVVPHDDPTLLFANAGMNQFKPMFMGTIEPSSKMAALKRAVNSQKCIRAGGKHNDLDAVGADSYHHTFFEMLGTWSFGDYFKKDAITWAYDLLVNVWGLDPARLYFTYYGGDPKAVGVPVDEEARDLWLSKAISPKHVIACGMKENFWEMGEVGPCGPCSELHYDLIGNRDASALVNQDDPTVIEIWNLVFIQYNREEGGNLKKLAAAHVDTGMGLERVVAVMQGKHANYDTDLFAYLFTAIQQITNAAPYAGRYGAADVDGVDMAYRVVADHIRTLSFSIADGAKPEAVGRGYVLRRIVRRAVRYARYKLNATVGGSTGFMPQLAVHVADFFADVWPELRANLPLIQQTILREEQAFVATLANGVQRFERSVARMISKGQTQMTGEECHLLYATFGFPDDLTQLMLEERKLTLDVEGFKACLLRAKTQSQEANAGTTSTLKLDTSAVDELKAKKVPVTDDSFKYGTVDTDVKDFCVSDITARVLSVFDGRLFCDATTDPSAVVGLLLDRTNFYAKQGGQIFDRGTASLLLDGADKDRADTVFQITSVYTFARYVLHVGQVLGEGVLRVGDSVSLHVDGEHRHAVMCNHTATHALNCALRETLVPAHNAELEQRGSDVDSERLRFDFSFDRPITADEIAKIEAHVNRTIAEKLRVFDREVPLAEAKKIKSLRAVFGEAYPDPVRVVSLGVPVEELLDNPEDERWWNYSVEFCGGTHLKTLGEAGAFVLLAQAASAAGERRVTAVTGAEAHAALACGEKFLAEARQLAARKLDSLAESKQLDAELTAFATRLGSASVVISWTHRHELDALLSEITKKVKSDLVKLGKDVKVVGAEYAAGIVAQLTASSSSSSAAAADGAAAAAVTAAPARCFVGFVDVGSSAPALVAATKKICESVPNVAVMLFSHDPDNKKAKVLCLAQVPKELHDRLQAGAWVAAACAAMDGRGGGKPDTAQGTSLKLEALEAAQTAARAFATEKLA